MARATYTFWGELSHHSMIGNAVWAILPKLGANKRVTLTQVKVFPEHVRGTSGNVLLRRLLLGAADPGNGRPCEVSALDTNYALPSGISVTQAGPLPASFSTLQDHFAPIVCAYRAPTSNSIGHGLSSSGPLPGGLHGWGPTRDSSVQRTTLRPNEALYMEITTLAAPASTYYPASPKAIHVSFEVDGHEYVTVATPNPLGMGVYFVALHNATGSNKVVSLLWIDYLDGHLANTPAFQLVPVGALFDEYLKDTARRLNSKLSRLDTASPTLSETDVLVLNDVAFAPYGMPINVFQDWVVTPYRGFNYLNTNDFEGPKFAKYFGEALNNYATGPTFDVPFMVSGVDLLAHDQKVVLHPGEGVALIKTAESAVISSSLTDGDGTAKAYSYAFTFIVQDDQVPTFSIQGHLSGSDVLILAAGTSTVLAEAQNSSGAALEYQYDYAASTYVDVVVYKEGYRPWIYRNYLLTAGNASIPVSQTSDPYYLI